ncbi:MAG: hypothetical protein R2698_03975 [Microthrixaceae bacterium]
MIVTLLSCGSTGCVGGREVGGSHNPTPPTPTLPVKAGVVGATFEYGKVRFEISRIEPFAQSSKGFPRIVVTARSRNTSDALSGNPDMELRCDESPKAGQWYRGSTWEPNFVLVVNETNEGRAILGFPAKATDPEYPVAACTDPTVVVTMSDPTRRAVQVIRYRVDPAVIAESIRARRGPVLPVPPQTADIETTLPTTSTVPPS